MFNFFKKKKRSQGLNAILLSDEGVAHACVTQNIGQPPTVHSVDFVAINDQSEIASTIKQFSQKNNLQNMTVTTCMQIADSNLTMLEKPDVADSELRQAVRWRVKDSLSFDINDAIVDVFEIPGQKERGRTPLVYVTAAEKSALKQCVQTFEQQEIEVESIDISELVMRNIAALLPEDQHGVALLKLDSSKGLMTLTHESSLYLARNIDVGYASLSAPNSILGETVDEGSGLSLEEGFSPDQQRTLDEIVLEVQRSLDYYESHFAKPAINSLVIAPLPNEMPGVIKYLAGALGLQVRILDLNAVLDSKTPLSQEQQANCFFSIGAALRATEVNEPSQKNGEAA